MNRVRRAGIYTPCLTDGDAVGNDVMGMARVLEGDGWDVRVFAEESHSKVIQVCGSRDAAGFVDDSSDLFVYHHSTGCSEGIDLLQRLRCRRVVKYHNVTPAAFFAKYNSLYESCCRIGREELGDLGRMNLDLYLACSQFSADELSAVLTEGRECLVVPPFHHVERLLSVAGDTRLFGEVLDDSPMILAVGRVVPNKNHGALIDSVGFLNGPCGVPVRLAIVGSMSPVFERYVAGLRARVQRVGLGGRVEFLGKVSDAELKACYQRAQILVSTSLHEGFCVPVVEAMAIGVPIVAHGAGAVAETVGDAGLVWETADPELLGASMRRVLDDTRLRSTLVRRGEARFRSMYTRDVIAGKFLGALRTAGIGTSDGGRESSGL